MKKLYYILLCIPVCLASCSKDNMEDPAFDNKVYIAATLGKSSAVTKVPYEHTPEQEGTSEIFSPTYENPLIADVWASTTTNVFKDQDLNGNNTNGDVADHVTAKFQSEKPQLLNNVIYSKNGRIVYFIGLYPSTNWNTGANGINAQHSFTGCEDIMFAPQVKGSYNNNGNNEWPTLHFRHLLTRFTLELKADGETTPEQESIRDAWGKIQSITIASNSKVNIDLSSASYGTDGNYNFDKISFEENASLRFYQTDTDNVFPEYDPNIEGSGYSIPTGGVAQEVAYVMCSPVNASENNTEDYTITISTEKRKNVAVKVNLKQSADSDFAGTTMGYHFTIQLNFKMGDRITVSATATDWSTGGTGSADIKEEDITTTSN